MSLYAHRTTGRERLLRSSLIDQVALAAAFALYLPKQIDISGEFLGSPRSI
jgi:hypothetical protein